MHEARSDACIRQSTCFVSETTLMDLGLSWSQGSTLKDKSNIIRSLKVASSYKKLDHNKVYALYLKIHRCHICIFMGNKTIHVRVV
jgi:hypothetical protein